MKCFNSRSIFFLQVLLQCYQHCRNVDGLLLSKPPSITFHPYNNLNARRHKRIIPIVSSSKHRSIQSTKLNAIQNNNDYNSIKSSLPTPQAIQEFFDTPVIEISLILLVLLSSLLVAINTIPSLSMDYRNINNMAQETITYLFAIEFILRWYAADMKSSYFVKPLTLIDIVVVIIPLAIRLCPTFGINFLPDLSNNSGLINLLLLRILRLQRVIVDTETFNKYLVALGIKDTDIRPYQLQLARVVLSIFTLLSVATGLIYTAEHEVNPAIPDYFTALYFGLTTLTTVGFGDITPVTFQGRLVVCGSILAGVAIIPAQGAALVEALLDFQNERLLKKKEQETKAKKSCFSFPGSSEIPTAKTTPAVSKNQFAVVTPECDPGDEECEDDDFLLDMKRSCMKCNVKSHRTDALYCWKCGHGFRDVGSVVNGDNNGTATSMEEAFS